MELDDVTKFNYDDLFKDPSEDEIRMGKTTQRQLEITELTTPESFGEDHGALVNGFNNLDEILKKKLPYSAISAVPLDVYVIKKAYLYFYLDNVAKQLYLTFVKKYP